MYNSEDNNPNILDEWARILELFVRFTQPKITYIKEMSEITKDVKKILFFLIHNPIDCQKEKRPDCHFWEYKEFRGISNYEFVFRRST